MVITEKGTGVRETRYATLAHRPIPWEKLTDPKEGDGPTLGCGQLHELGAQWHSWEMEPPGRRKYIAGPPWPFRQHMAPSKGMAASQQQLISGI